MKKSVRSLTFVVLVILLTVAVIPVSASRPMPTTGEQINILSGGDRSIGAGEPFFIMQGWTIDDTKNVGQYDFKLELAGVSLKNPLRFISKTVNLNMRIYNFPEGLPAGTYAYTGRWYAPCGEFFDPADCAIPNQSVEAYSSIGNLLVTP